MDVPAGSHRPTISVQNRLWLYSSFASLSAVFVFPNWASSSNFRLCWRIQWSGYWWIQPFGFCEPVFGPHDLYKVLIRLSFVALIMVGFQILAGFTEEGRILGDAVGFACRNFYSWYEQGQHFFARLSYRIFHFLVAGQWSLFTTYTSYFEMVRFKNLPKLVSFFFSRF